MNRRTFLSVSAGATLAACSQSPAPEAPRPPNIIWIMADDLGWAHLGSYGQTEIRTPRLDALAQQSLRFTNAYAGCTVCAPSRSSLMTGLHTGHTPVRGNSGGLPLPAGAVTVAETLRQAGYATGCFGKWGLGGEGTEGVPNRQGFDEFLGPLHQIPHHEFTVPAEDFDAYAGKYQEQPFIREDRGFVVQPQPAAAFAGMVTRLDRQVGALLDKLEALGLAENTVVFFTSDNGSVEFPPIANAFHGTGVFRGFKTDLYEGGIRVPMLVRWPGKVTPGVSDYPWAFYDFLPTAAEIAGAEPPPGLDGQSILPTLLGQGQEPPALLYWEAGPARAVRLGDWKAIRPGPDAPIELYDLAHDPGETTDVAAQHADLVAGAEKILNAQHVDPPQLVEPGWP
ncbi:MAG: sulfatase-like hydrolase/transferase [Acidobacteria bacterium]|nr:sulfatase-like hydrolase/transferase [Acidobacteriota bacterium]